MLWGVQYAQITKEKTQDTYDKSVVLLTRAFGRLGLQSENTLQRLTFWLVRPRAKMSIPANWHDWNFDDENDARKSWARDNVLRNYVDYPNFESKLRAFAEPRPALEAPLNDSFLSALLIVKECEHLD